MAAPVDSARNPTSITTAGTSHNISVGSPAAGTLLIVFVRFAAAPGTVTFTGYTSLNGAAGDTSDATDDTTIVFYRWADGTEGASDTLTTVNSVKLAAMAYEITGAANPEITPPTISTVAVGTTGANVANSDNVVPANAPVDTLYLSLAGGDGEGAAAAYTAAPTNYSNLLATNSGTGGLPATNVVLGGASRELTNSSSENPGAFTHGGHTNGWTAYTVAISAGGTIPVPEAADGTASAPTPTVAEQVEPGAASATLSVSTPTPQVSTPVEFAGVAASAPAPTIDVEESGPVYPSTSVTMRGI